MLQRDSQIDIKERAGAINLTLKRLAQAHGLDFTTAYRIARGGDVLVSTHAKLVDALIAEEIRLRDYLLSIHPIGDAR
jgi:hypothetical protein